MFGHCCVDFKWAGHRLAHVFAQADGWSTASHKPKMTLLEAPTGTLLFYSKDIMQEIVHMLLLEEYDVSKKRVIFMDKRQDKTAASTQTETSGSKKVNVPGAQEGARRNGVKTEMNEAKSSGYDVAFTCDDIRCFYKLFWN